MIKKLSLLVFDFSASQFNLCLLCYLGQYTVKKFREIVLAELDTSNITKGMCVVEEHC